MRRRAFAAFLAVASSWVRPTAAEAGIGISGYFKSLCSTTRSALNPASGAGTLSIPPSSSPPPAGAPYWLDINRARLTLDGAASLGGSARAGTYRAAGKVYSPPEVPGAELAPGAAGADAGSGVERDLRGPRLEFHADYDHEARVGSYFQTAQYRALGLAEPPAYLDMDRTIGSGGSYQWRHRLYRGWVGLVSPSSSLRFGRQRVAWGTGRLWNPTDVLNPYAPTTLERDERRGVDAAYLRRGLGDLGQAEGAWALGDRWASTDLVGRLKGNWRQADLSAMGGKVASSTSSWTAGSDFSCNLWEGNLHGEWSYADLKTRSPFWRALLGYEYTFSSSPAAPWLKDVWILAEYFHNGAGDTAPARYRPARLLSGREVSLARDYAGMGFSKDLHPLVRLELYEIVNLDDGSHFFGPSVSWNAVRNLYLLAGLQRFGGSTISEYGRLPNIGYLQAQFYF